MKVVKVLILNKNTDETYPLKTIKQPNQLN